MVRRVLLTLALLGAFMVPAAPASAHTNYCGHLVHWHWGQRVEFYSHHTNLRTGVHYHTVYVIDGWTGRYFQTHPC